MHSLVNKLEDENSTFKNNIEIGGRGNCLTYFVVKGLKIETKTEHQFWLLSANFFLCFAKNCIWEAYTF